MVLDRLNAGPESPRARAGQGARPKVLFFLVVTFLFRRLSMNAQRALRPPGLLLAAFLCLLLASPARAGLLPIQLRDPEGPITLGLGGTLTYTYDSLAGTGLFHAETFPVALAFESPVPWDITPGLSTIDLVVDSSGNFVANGSGVMLMGAINFDGDLTDDVSGELLYGRVLDFGFGADEGQPGTFNGIFEIEGGALTETILLSGGGSLAAMFRVGQDLGGFFVFAEGASAGELGVFTADFASDTVKDNLGVVVPSPPAWILGLLGTCLLVGYRRFARRCPHPAP
jgi:hypothetical protein